MKLLIEIDENIYLTLKDKKMTLHQEQMQKASAQDYIDAFAILNLIEALSNGTVITDDMISRSALREEISNAFIDGAKKSIFKKYIDNAPTIGCSD